MHEHKTVYIFRKMWYNEISQYRRGLKMSLITQIKEDIMAARRAKDLKTLVSLQTLLGDAEKIGKAKLRETTDEEVVSIVKKAIENNNICLAQKPSVELTEKLNTENDLIFKYLPVQMSDAEIKLVISQIISEKALNNVSQAGQIMGEMKKRFAGKYDGALAMQLAKEALVS